jgi:hypothetical protein
MSEIIINGVDQTVGNILTFAIGLFSEDSEHQAYKWFLQKFIEKCNVLKKLPKVVITEL